MGSAACGKARIILPERWGGTLPGIQRAARLQVMLWLKPVGQTLKLAGM